MAACCGLEIATEQYCISFPFLDTVSVWIISRPRQRGWTDALQIAAKLNPGESKLNPGESCPSLNDVRGCPNRPL